MESKQDSTDSRCVLVEQPRSGAAGRRETDPNLQTTTVTIRFGFKRIQSIPKA
jgi:hypothetical protein